MNKLPYDNTNPENIEKYAKKLIGKTFKNILEIELNEKELKEKIEYFNNPKGKGSLGNLLEEYFFYYKPNNVSDADFHEAKTELKVTPYEKNNKNKLKAGERLVLGMIPNDRELEIELKKSHLISKLGLMLLVFYLRDRSKERLDYSIDYVSLFSVMSKQVKEDLIIIEDDYKKIVQKIRDGKAHELSEGDTKYLGACTKGSTAEKSLQPQYYNKEILAKRRAFSLKQSYMTYVLNHYIKGEIETYDPIFSEEYLKNSDFDTEVINKINKYIGKKEKDLYKLFNISTSVKQKNNMLICRILGVKTKNAQEFEKANIEIKTIRVKKNGTPRESMSFPSFKIKEFIKEDFETSQVYNLFSEKRFLFVVFKENEDEEYILLGTKFWNMPITELETIGYKEWLKYQNKFKNGINFNITTDKNGNFKIYNDLPNKTETEIFHIRPHTSNTIYMINGKQYGKGILSSDGDELPNGDIITKQSFWLNDTYIEKIIKNIL